MQKSMSTEQVVKQIADTLDCSNRVVANLMGLSPHTLSNNKKTAVTELTLRTSTRLKNLYRIVVDILGTHRPEMIYEVIHLHAYTDRKGRKDSVISALHQDKYELEMLEQIVQLACAQYESKRRENLIEFADEESATI